MSKITLGQNVRKASNPKPIGFGLGSLVNPNVANRMTANNGPVPRINRVSPVQNVRERRNFGRGWCSISKGGANVGRVVKRGAFLYFCET